MRRKLDSLDQDFILKNRNNFTVKQLSKKLNLFESSINQLLEQNPIKETQTSHIAEIKPENVSCILDQTKSERGDLYNKSVSTNWPDRIHRIKK